MPSTRVERRADLVAHVGQEFALGLARLSAWSLCRLKPRLWWTMATLMAVAKARIARRAIWLSQRNIPYDGAGEGNPRGRALPHRQSDEGGVPRRSPPVRRRCTGAHPAADRRRREPEVDKEKNPAVDEGQRMPGGDQDQAYRAQDADVENAGEESQPWRRRCPCGRSAAPRFPEATVASAPARPTQGSRSFGWKKTVTRGSDPRPAAVQRRTFAARSSPSRPTLAEAGSGRARHAVVLPDARCCASFSFRVVERHSDTVRATAVRPVRQEA